MSFSEERIISLAVLLTCFNRVDKTLACLQNLFRQQFDLDINIKVFLVDDGSTDKTSEKVHAEFPDVNILQGDGNLFWNGGMHKAFGEALKYNFDYYLWLNDDTNLHDGALNTLIKTHMGLVEKSLEKSVVITATRDPQTGEFSYGGYRRLRKLLNPLDLQLIPASNELTECDTFCGNVVLIPRQVADVVGNINPVYKHRWGDVDYGLRAHEKGCKNWVAPGILADCEANPNADRWREVKMPFKQKIQELHSLKGIGKRDWYLYTSNYGGLLWPLAWVRPYVRIFYDSFIKK